MLLYGVKLIQVLSDDKRNYDDFVKLLGFYFQLRDDYCNLKQLEVNSFLCIFLLYFIY